MSIELAIKELEEQVRSLGQGTPQQPAELSTDWYTLRALSLGLSCLRRMQAKGVYTDARVCERFYRDCLKYLKADETTP